MMTVVKADGYGHGMVEVARAARAAGPSGSASPTVDEALALRAAGDTGRVLSWLAVPGEDYAPRGRGRRRPHRLHRRRGRRDRRRGARRSGSTARVQLKVDTGLSRGGADRRRTGPAWSRPRPPPRRPARSRSPASGRTSPAPTSPTTRPTTRRRRRSRRRCAVATRRHRARGAAPGQLGRRAAPALVAASTWCGAASRPTGSRPAPDVVTADELGLRAGDDRAGPVALVKRVPAGAGVSYGHTYDRRGDDASAWCRWGTATASRGTRPRGGGAGGRPAAAGARPGLHGPGRRRPRRRPAWRPATRWCCSGPAPRGAHGAGLGRGVRHDRLRDRHRIGGRSCAATSRRQGRGPMSNAPLARLAAAGAARGRAAVAAGFVVERRVVQARRAGRDGADELGGLRSDAVPVLTDDGVRPARRGRRGRAVRRARDRLRHSTSTDEATLVFVHGYALNLDCWHFQREYFRGKRRMVFYDQRSHGRSEPVGQGDATIDQLGRRPRRGARRGGPRRPGRPGRPLDGRHDDHGARRAAPGAVRGPGRRRGAGLHHGRGLRPHRISAG